MKNNNTDRFFTDRFYVSDKVKLMVNTALFVVVLTGVVNGLLPDRQISAASVTYYVATNGSDSYPGTSSQPFRTIQKAANVVNPGDTVIVRDGVYKTGSGTDFVLSIRRAGTSSGWITFKSANKWKAVIDGSDVTYYPLQFSGSTGYIRIEGFQIRNGKNKNIKFQDSGVHHLVFKGNRIHHSQDSGVHGYVNSLVFDGNYFHDNGTSDAVNLEHGIYSSSNNVVIKNNIFARHVGGWAMQISGGSNWKIFNNVFAYPNPNRDGHIMLWHEYNNVQITNNIFYQPRNSAIRKYYDAGTVSVKNNLTTVAKMVGGATGNLTVSGSILSTDPKFVNPSGADFHLQSASPAINKGVTLSEVPCDYDGKKRPSGTAYDIGAFEYGFTVAGTCN
jgi:hypothetical protein